jgi:hypothetical protein
MEICNPPLSPFRKGGVSGEIRKGGGEEVGFRKGSEVEALVKGGRRGGIRKGGIK